MNGTTTQFVYDGQNFVQERDGTSNVTANLLTGLGLDEVYARTKGAITNSFLMDHLGSIIAEADASGILQTSYSYEPYGKTTQTGAASDNSQRFTGREQDTTDSYYYRARYYSPNFDRFLSEDPIGFVAGPNLYGYVGGDPINSVDPSGLQGSLPGQAEILCPPAPDGYTLVGTGDVAAVIPEPNFTTGPFFCTANCIYQKTIWCFLKLTKKLPALRCRVYRELDA